MNSMEMALPRLDVNKLIVEYQSPLKSYIRNRVSSEQDAEDILQEVFYQLAKADSMMNPIEQVSAWLYKVAKNQVFNWKAKKREESLPQYYSDEEDEEILKEFSDILFNEDASNSTPETEYLRSLVWVELEKALEELPVEQREVYEMTELQGVPVKEIAKQLGIPQNTVLSRKRYAVLHLRKRMSTLYYELLGS